MTTRNLFDADASVDALAPPRLKMGGVVYTGRILSWFEVRQARTDIRALLVGGTVADDDLAAFAVRAIASLEFTREDGAALDPTAVLNLPPGVAWRMVTSFFSAGDLHDPQGEEPPTDGPGSPPAGSGTPSGS